MKPFHTPLSRIALSLSLLLLCFFAGVPAKAQTLQTTFDDKGLSTLKYNNFIYYDKNAGIGGGFEIRGNEWGSPHPSRPDWNPVSKTLTWFYNWGSVSCQYETPPNSSCLNLNITVTNTTNSARSGLNIYPLTLRFPQFPQLPGGGEWDLATPRGNSNSEGPTVQTANFGTSGNLTLVNQSVTGDLIVGFLGKEAQSLPVYYVYVGSTPLPPEGGGATQWPQFDRTIPANSYDTYNISLRFSAEADTYAVASKIYSDYAAANPSQLNWPDRRPIGSLILSEPPGEPHNVPTTNPRGWHPKDSLSTVDITTPAGIQDFRERMLAFADRSIEVMRDKDAQGMITWDIEGSEFPHTTTEGPYPGASYIGDPRLISNLAPEMDGIADAYFKKFTDAGFRVGICIRPEQLTNNYGNGAAITYKTLKNSISYPVQNGSSIYNQLLKKIDYAKKRWKCTLFYIDSNVASAMNDVVAIKAVAAARPDVLLIPEHENFSYYAYCAPYNDLKFTQPNGVFPGTPPDVRRTYPNAFSAIQVGGPVDVLDSIRPQVVDAVSKGDVLIFNAWYDAPENSRIKSIYAEAYPLRVTTTEDVINSSDGKVSLREALLYANSHPGYDHITFGRSVAGTIKLNGTALPIVAGDCFIEGPGANTVTVDGDGKSRIMKIAAGVTVTVSGLYFTNGNASGSDNNGGAFYNDGNLTINHSNIKNSTGYWGGGIFNTGTFLLLGSTISSNSALDSGGAITNTGIATIENSTISGNSTATGSTGGAGIDCYGSSAKINLNFCTITANTGANSTANARAGIWMAGGSSLSIANTIVYGNGTRDIQHGTTNVSSSGYNIIGTKGSATGFLSTDKIGVNPLLGPLQNNGGLTPTHTIMSGSPAINASNPNVAPPVSDQRGYSRVVNGRADIGSFESNFGTSSSSGNLMAPPSGSSGSS